MSTGAQSSTLLDQAQKAGNADNAFKEHIDAALKDLHTCLPGIIVSYDPDTQTCQAQPAIQRVFTEKGAANLPVCVDVPVAFPGGGDFYLTFPVKAGDECILFFSERAIDHWHVNGGTQLPAEYRLHDLSDAMAVVGINSQGKKLTEVQTDGAELRSRDRNVYIKLMDSGIEIKGDITHIGSTTQQGSTTSTGTINGQTNVLGGGISLNTHTHTDPQGGSTGGPL